MDEWHPVTISAEGIEAHILPFGARLMALKVAGHDVVLGLPEARDYAEDASAMGAICGRYANRIGAAQFRLGVQRFMLDANEGPNCLHGGRAGFGVLPWQIVAISPEEVTLSLLSEAGDMGFPGRCVARAIYAVRPYGLAITLEAEVDAPCPVNLVAHPYFNLNGGGTTDGHDLAIAASRYLVTDAALLPTGAIADVSGTAFDFRMMRRLTTGAGYPRLDVTLLRDEPGFGLAARLVSRTGGICMDVHTDQPALQLYDGAGLTMPFSGICLEAQRLPDAPNHPHFSSALVMPDEVSRQRLELTFTPFDDASPIMAKDRP